MSSRQLLLLLSLILTGITVASAQQSPAKQELKNYPVEVFQVLGLPLNIHEATLLERENGYVLRCRMSSEANSTILGMRYSLTAIEDVREARPVVNRIEGFELGAAGTKTVTFVTSIKFKPKDGSRLVLMLEQVLSREAIWEVVKAKDALEKYVMGDFSSQPSVLRVANQIDAPVTRVIRVIH